jgi:hypothetical protein
MEANNYQIGGTHYSDTELQHWDFAMLNQLNYLLGCATKYVIRWKKKNGIEDLRKAVHYIAKAEEQCAYHYKFEIHSKLMIMNKPYMEFINSIGNDEKHIVIKILQNDLSGAQYLLGELISNIECAPSRTYVNPDL